MADVTASMVKELREKTDAGMMDAKKALVECNGDMEAAVDYLRKKGLAKAAKKSGRTAAEGLVAVCASADNKQAALVEVNAETDFVARINEKGGNCKARHDARGDQRVRVFGSWTSPGLCRVSPRRFLLYSALALGLLSHHRNAL